MKLEFEKYPSREKVAAFAVDASFTPNAEDLVRITEVCNQPLVYAFLFKEKFGGRPYTTDDAKGFVEWAKKGWQDNSYFVFLIKDENNKIIGCMDIKEQDLKEEAGTREIGYWADSNSPGFMTNAVKILQNFGEEKGFKKLFGIALSDNEKSQNVMLRAGLKSVGSLEKDGKSYKKFEIKF